MAVVLLVCLGLPFALAIAWEKMVGRVTDPRTLERQAKLSVLGEIAHLPVRFAVSHSSTSSRINRDLRLVRGEHRQSADESDAFPPSWRHADSGGHQRRQPEGKTSVVCQLAIGSRGPRASNCC